MIAVDLTLEKLEPHNQSARSHICFNHAAFVYGHPSFCPNPQASVLVNVGNGRLRPLCKECAGELAVQVASAFVFLRGHTRE